jgi:hypothetical protein
MLYTGWPRTLPSSGLRNMSRCIGEKTPVSPPSTRLFATRTSMSCTWVRERIRLGFANMQARTCADGGCSVGSLSSWLDGVPHDLQRTIKQPVPQQRLPK